MKYISYALNALLIILLISQCGKKNTIIKKETVTHYVHDTIWSEPIITYLEPKKEIIFVKDQEQLDSLEKRYKHDLELAENDADYYRARYEALKAGKYPNKLELLPPYRYTYGKSILSNGIVNWTVKGIGEVDSVGIGLNTWNTTEKITVDNTKDRGIGIGVDVYHDESLKTPIKLIYENNGTQLIGGVIMEVRDGKFQAVSPVIGINKIFKYRSKKKRRQNKQIINK